MDQQDLTKAVLWQVGKAVIAILITLAIGLLGVQLELRHKVLLPIGIFIAFSVIEALWVIRRVDKRLVRHHDIWSHVSELDALLSTIRANFSSLKETASGGNDLFLRHFKNAIQDLNRELETAARDGTLVTNASFFLSIEHTLDAFSRSSDKVWRFTWLVDDPDSLLSDREWVAWFRHCVDLLMKKKLAGIRTIIIVESEAVALNSKVVRLIEFYKSIQNLECSIATRANFVNACQAAQMDNTTVLDMGIYGDRLLYLNQSYEPAIMGIFHRKEDVIERHKKLFENIWSSKMYCTNVADKKATGHLSFDDLVKAAAS